jgi:Protein DA1/LIM domain
METTMNDEALARRMQDEIDEEARLLDDGTGRRGPASVSTIPFPASVSLRDGMGDDELFLILQRQELDALRSGRPVDDMELARRIQQEESLGSMENEYRDQVKYARQIKERAVRHAESNGRSVSTPTDNARPSYPFWSGAEDQRRTHRNRESELEIARQVQEIEAIQINRSRQEKEDARLAILLATSNKSYQNLDIETVSSIQNQSQDNPDLRPLPEPSQNQILDAPNFPHSNNTAFSSYPYKTPVERDRSQEHASSTQERTSPSPMSNPHRATISPKSNQRKAPPGMAMFLNESPLSGIPAPDVSGTKDRNKKFASLFQRSSKEKSSKNEKVPNQTQKPVITIPAPIPPRSRAADVPLPYAADGNQESYSPNVDSSQGSRKKSNFLSRRAASICTICQKPATSFLVALEKKFHPECFKCAGCYEVIDANGSFAYMTDETGDKHPLHRSCYSELYGVKCAVCKQLIPYGPDGKISFIKHPFFDQEQMCPHHGINPGRRCTGCHRFEPMSEPFADLNDNGRCVCYACCRSVIVDSEEAQALWESVIFFFENFLKLPIWKDMRKVPILIVGYDALNEHLMASGVAHDGSSQVMTRGLCLTEHQSGRRLKLAKLKFDKNNSGFVSVDAESRGYTYFQVPDADKSNPDASVTAILCLSGLPRDLTASVLAHEATHAWIKLHPRFDCQYLIPAQVEEGCAQLIAMLYLAEGLGPSSVENYAEDGPSDEKLRQYFKFCIETDDSDVYGEGYRKAALAYANIGIEALLSHIVLYQNFPKT